MTTIPAPVRNSLVVAGLTILFCLVLSAAAGHALARFPLPGKEVIFLILLALMMLPFRALLIPPCLRPNFLGRTATEAGLAVLHTGLSGSIRPDPGPRRTRP
jgi:multiple sugar transport system permease protein